MNEIGNILKNIGRKHKNAVLLYPDFSPQAIIADFLGLFPERSFHFGMQSGNLISASWGFAVRGKLPIIVAGEDFFVRSAAQIKSLVAYFPLNIKMIAAGDSKNSAKYFFSFLTNLNNLQVKELAGINPNLRSRTLENYLEGYGPFYIAV